jgi:hypothetical protein
MISFTRNSTKLGLHSIDALVGRRCLLLPPHPHAGTTGRIASIDLTAAGWAARVVFDDKSLGENGAYVFRAREVRCTSIREYPKSY